MNYGEIGHYGYRIWMEARNAESELNNLKKTLEIIVGTLGNVAVFRIGKKHSREARYFLIVEGMEAQRQITATEYRAMRKFIPDITKEETE